jgi:hypothetical protein
MTRFRDCRCRQVFSEMMFGGIPEKPGLGLMRPRGRFDFIIASFFYVYGPTVRYILRPAHSLIYPSYCSRTKMVCCRVVKIASAIGWVNKSQVVIGGMIYEAAEYLPHNLKHPRLSADRSACCHISHLPCTEWGRSAWAFHWRANLSVTGKTGPGKPFLPWSLEIIFMFT